MRLAFEGFEIDPDGPRLIRDGREVPLEPRTLDLLYYLAQHPGRVVRKDELLERVWNAHTLSEGVLSNAIAKLRKALGQAADAREPIETVHRRGYRFHAVAQRQPPLLAASPTPPEPLDPFVGRHAIMRLLRDRLDLSSAGNAQLVLITGEPGIGKSRTLDELASHARGAGFSVWRGTAYPGGAAPAFWPWVEVVRAALAEPGARKQMPSDSWALATLVPEHLGPARPIQDAHALRFRLFDELTRWFAALSTRAPRLIVLEDLHWADAASVELLGHLMHGLAGSRVLLAAAARELDTARDDGASAARQRVLRAATLVALPGLTPSEVTELATVLAGEPPAGAAERLHQLTQGNPLFVRQVLQLLAQRDQALAVEHLTAAALPPVVRDVIAQRLLALPAETRALLAAASVIGPNFDAATLAWLHGSPLEATLVLLQPALRFNAVRLCSEAPGQSGSSLRAQRFEFTHTIVVESLYDELALPERGSLHARLARAPLPSGADPQQIGEIARHSLLAVPFDLDACVAHCRRAADAAREVSGFEAAAMFLAHALEKLDVGDPELAQRGELCCELLYQLGLDQLCAGELHAGCRTLEAGARHASNIDARRWLPRFASRIASWGPVRGSSPAVVQIIDDALARVDDAETDVRAALLARRAEVGLGLDAIARRALYDEAKRLAALGGAAELLLDVAIACVGARDPSRLDEARAAIATYRALEAREPAAPLGLQRRLRRFAVELTEYWYALTHGELEAADLAIAQATSMTETLQVPHVRYALDLMGAMRLLAGDRVEDAAAAFERNRVNAGSTSALGMASAFGTLLLLEARGELEALAQLTRAADISMLDQLPPPERIGVAAWLAAVQARAGDQSCARSFLARVPARELECMPASYCDLSSLCILAEVYCDLGDLERAEQLYAQLLPYAKLNAVGPGCGYKGSVAHYLGMLALRLDETGDAIAHLQRAVAFNHKLGMPSQLAATRALLARARARA